MEHENASRSSMRHYMNFIFSIVWETKPQGRSFALCSYFTVGSVTRVSPAAEEKLIENAVRASLELL